jgi:proteasome accessory factor B
MQETDFKEPSADERNARRMLSLAIALSNSRSPWPTSRIRADFYSDLKDEAFKKAFSRDRTRLEAAGVTIKRCEGVGSDQEWLWSIDEGASYAADGCLDPDDALALDFLLLPIASNPAFPYASDLRVALAKIDRAFDGTSSAAIPPEARRRNVFLTRVEESLLDRHPIVVDYERADGTQLTRSLLPYGLFYLNGETYLVAAEEDIDSPAHTYNLVRVKSLKEQPGRSYEIPEDFDLRDFIRLPFQLGPIVYVAEFYEPNTGERQSHRVADESRAVAWAISEGLVPTKPKALVEAWKERPEKWAGDGQ